jgi:hypothetical protein
MKLALRIASGLIAAAALAIAGAPPVRAGESSRGGSFLPLGWDAKGMSLGGAASVLIRGEESAYWNPANLVFIERGGLSLGMVELVQDLPSRYSIFAGGLGFGEAHIEPDSTFRWHRFALALSGSALGLELAGGSAWDENTIGLSAAYAFTAYSALGVTVRGLWNRTGLSEADARGWAVDLGLTERVTRRIWVAIAARNVASRISYPQRSESVDPTWNFAVALRDLLGSVSTEFDVVLKRSSIERLQAGAELPIYERYFVVTGGLDVRLIEGERTIPSFGLGSSYGFAEIFIGFSFDPVEAFGRHTHISLSLDF